MKRRLDCATESQMLRRNRSQYMRDLIETLNVMKRFKKEHGITKTKNNCMGFSDREQKWYGWSHRAVVGFGIGDMVFEVDFGDDKTSFVRHGKRKIKNMSDAEESARRFAEYVS